MNRGIIFILKLFMLLGIIYGVRCLTNDAYGPEVGDEFVEYIYRTSVFQIVLCCATMIGLCVIDYDMLNNNKNRMRSLCVELQKAINILIIAGLMFWFLEECLIGIFSY